MKLVDDPETVRWLRALESLADSFDWDDGNSGKSHRKHGVTDEEIESLFSVNWLFYGRVSEPDHGEWRGIILSQGVNGRLLTLVFTRRGSKIRPVSCRPMRAKEKAAYASAKTQA